MMADAIRATLEAFWALLVSIPWDPRLWQLETWLILLSLAALGLLLALLRRRRKRAWSKPELLIAMGEINLIQPSRLDGSTPRAELGLIVSNLSPYAVQLLELALKTDVMEAPVVIDAPHLIPADSSIQFEETIPWIEGETGVLNLYLYTSATSRRTFKLRAAFHWEPWYDRYRVSARDQNLAAVASLPSEGLKRTRRGAEDDEPRARRFPEDF